MAKKRVRRRKRRKNPLYRTKSGRFTGRKTSKRVGTKRRRRRNPVSNSWHGQPRRHRKAALKGVRRKRRRRRNPVANAPRRRRRRRNPVANAPRRRRRRNPVANVHRSRRSGRRKMRLRNNPLEAISSAFEQAFSKEALETVFQTSLGIGGTLVGAKLVSDLIPSVTKSDVGRVLTTAGVGIVGAGVAGMITRDAKLSSRFLVGGMIAAGLQLLGVILPPEAKAWVPTVGLGADAESVEFERAIEEEVVKELQAGTSEYIPAAGSEEYILPAGTEMHVPIAGNSAYLTEVEAEKAAGVGTYLTEKEAETATGMGDDFVDEFGSKGNVPERF